MVWGPLLILPNPVSFGLLDAFGVVLAENDGSVVICQIPADGVEAITTLISEFATEGIAIPIQMLARNPLGVVAMLQLVKFKATCDQGLLSASGSRDAVKGASIHHREDHSSNDMKRGGSVWEVRARPQNPPRILA